MDVLSERRGGAQLAAKGAQAGSGWAGPTSPPPERKPERPSLQQAWHKGSPDGSLDLRSPPLPSVLCSCSLPLTIFGSTSSGSHQTHSLLPPRTATTPRERAHVTTELAGPSFYRWADGWQRLSHRGGPGSSGCVVLTKLKVNHCIGTFTLKIINQALGPLGKE